MTTELTPTQKQNFIENFLLYYTNYQSFFDILDEHIQYRSHFYNKTIEELRSLKEDDNFYQICKELYEKMNEFEL